MTQRPDPHRGHRFPAEIIAHAVWLYHVFSLSLRDVELLLAERGVIVSYESIRRWCLKFARSFADTSGYTRRALAEAAIGRYKRVIGDALRCRTDGRRATEVGIAVHVLNRMLDLGRLKSVRVCVSNDSA